jgi:hypothetical protein
MAAMEPEPVPEDVSVIGIGAELSHGKIEFL